jgi:hypothetical protein
MQVSLDPDMLAALRTRDERHASTDEVGDDLAAAVRHTAVMRRLFYLAVLVVALYGTATGAVAAFGLPWWISISGTFALELGGVTFLSHADVRRRLGEHATAPRLLGAAITGAAATFNVLTHPDPLLGGFFALMSVLGFVSWWLDAENKRRDRLRARGHLPAPAPAYQLWSHWIRRPVITSHARSIAKAHPELGLYGSLEAAATVRRRQRRNAALADALHRRIQSAVGAEMARIAVLTYDMDEVARRLRATADYDGLTALLAGDLTAERLVQPRDAAANGGARRCPDRRAPHPPAPPTAVTDRPDPAGADRRRSGTPPSPIDPHDQDLAPGRRVRVTIVGDPAIHDADGAPVGGVRAKSLELLVFLAVHRTGAALADICGAVWPDVPAQRATQRLSTCLSNLRGRLRSVLDSAGADDRHDPGARRDPIVNTGGHYHLDPAIVSVDWWHLLDAHRTDSAAVAPGDLQAAAARIADGRPYPWLHAAPIHPTDGATA